MMLTDTPFLEAEEDGKMSIKIRPFGTKLTPEEFFRVFEQIRDNNGHKLTMDVAYARMAELIAQNQLAQTYSGFDSFKQAYYAGVLRQHKSIA